MAIIWGSTRCPSGKASRMTLMCGFRCTVRALCTRTHYIQVAPSALLIPVASDQCAVLEYCPVVCSLTRQTTSILPPPSSNWRELLRRQIPQARLQIPRSMAFHSCPTSAITHPPPSLPTHGGSTASLSSLPTTTRGDWYAWSTQRTNFRSSGGAQTTRKFSI